MGDRAVPSAVVSDPRAVSEPVRLARLGFGDARISAEYLDLVLGSGESIDRDGLLADLALCADPDQAVRLLSDLVLAEPATVSALADPPTRRALTAVMGMSLALGEHLVRHPEQVADLGSVSPEAPSRDAVCAEVLASVGSVDGVARAATPDVLDDLRVAYRRLLVHVAVRDLVHEARVDQVAAELADLADAAVGAGLAIARADLPAQSAPCRIAVIGMGKCGARELNYVSDVDVIFVAEPVDGADEVASLKTATRLATGLMRACSEATAEGSLWQVDAALRPEGKQGALVRTLASHVGYYERWATTWEFQALLKARPMAGDAELGRAYVDAVAPMVWSAADRDDFVSDVQRMRQRVEDHIPAREAGRQLKLGPGGLRDVEFAVQLLQLVHGRSDVMLRSPTTLVALEALATWGYIGREDGATLGAAYRFLRTLEHRIQLHQLRRTHVVPDDEADLRRIGRSLGYRADSVAELTDAWRRHAREVRRIHEKLFYRPLLQAVARLDAGAARLTPQAAVQRLEALGYSDPEGALRHLEALTSGVSRRAAIQRTLLPVLLGWFADGPDPDSALLGFRRLSDDLGGTPWYLRLLRDESVAAERMARLLSTSRYASDLLLGSPDTVALLAADDDLRPRTLVALESEALSAVVRYLDPQTGVGAVRALRRRELLRISAAEILGMAQTVEVMEALTDVTTATIRGALQAAVQAIAPQVDGKFPTRMAVIAMGRYGGSELGYGSDADVIFVHDPYPGADADDAARAALALANEMRRLLHVPSTDPPLEIDADLRPEGRQGPLVRTLASYAAYYERWSAPWEAQALLRAVPVAGDPDLGQAFVELIDPLRYPSDGLSADHVREMRRLKARMESERLPRGADPTLHTKLGRGGLSDVEWVAQLLQLRRASRIPELRTTSTLGALRAAREADLLGEQDADELIEAWLLASRVRNATMLARGTPSDMVPSAGRDLAIVAALLGYRAGSSGDLLEDYRRTTRRARAVVERIFYD